MTNSMETKLAEIQWNSALLSLSAVFKDDQTIFEAMKSMRIIFGLDDTKNVYTIGFNNKNLKDFNTLVQGKFATQFDIIKSALTPNGEAMSQGGSAIYYGGSFGEKINHIQQRISSLKIRLGDIISEMKDAFRVLCSSMSSFLKIQMGNSVFSDLQDFYRKVVDNNEFTSKDSLFEIERILAVYENSVNGLNIESFIDDKKRITVEIEYLMNEIRKRQTRLRRRTQSHGGGGEKRKRGHSGTSGRSGRSATSGRERSGRGRSATSGRERSGRGRAATSGRGRAMSVNSTSHSMSRSSAIELEPLSKAESEIHKITLQDKVFINYLLLKCFISVLFSTGSDVELTASIQRLYENKTVTTRHELVVFKEEIRKRIEKGGFTYDTIHLLSIIVEYTDSALFHTFKYNLIDLLYWTLVLKNGIDLSGYRIIHKLKGNKCIKLVLIILYIFNSLYVYFLINKYLTNSRTNNTQIFKPNPQYCGYYSSSIQSFNTNLRSQSISTRGIDDFIRTSFKAIIDNEEELFKEFSNVIKCIIYGVRLFAPKKNNNIVVSHKYHKFLATLKTLHFGGNLKNNKTRKIRIV
jgi:hypothetical protein